MVYPPTLIDTDWQKNKGALAKTAGETGVGAQMKATKALFDKIDWSKFNVRSTYSTGEAVDADVVECKQEGLKIEPVRQELMKLQKLAQGAEAKFKKTKLIPKASAAHALKVAQTAINFATELKSVNPFPKFEEAKQQVLATAGDRAEAMMKATKSYAAKVEIGIKRVNATPTMVVFNSFWKEEIRGLGAALSRTNLAAKHSPVWVKLSAQSFLAVATTTPEDIKKRVLIVEKALNALKPDLT